MTLDYHEKYKVSNFIKRYLFHKRGPAGDAALNELENIVANGKEFLLLAVNEGIEDLIEADNSQYENEITKLKEEADRLREENKNLKEAYYRDILNTPPKYLTTESRKTKRTLEQIKYPQE